LLIEDDGVGGAQPSAGSGLSGLHDRVAALNGTLVVDSLRPGAPGSASKSHSLSRGGVVEVSRFRIDPLRVPISSGRFCAAAPRTGQESHSPPDRRDRQ
jgi:hypothetical protein